MTDAACGCPACYARRAARAGRIFECDSPICDRPATRIFTVIRAEQGLLSWRMACDDVGHGDSVVQIAKMMIAAHRPDAHSVVMVRRL